MADSVKNKGKKTKKDKGLLKELFVIEGEDANSPEFLLRYMRQNKRAVESYAHEVGTATEKEMKKKKTRTKK